MQEINEIRVTWQLAVMISALAFLPVAAVALVNVLIEPGQDGETGVKIVCGSAILAGVFLCVLAVRSRLRPVKNPNERAKILRNIGLGIFVIAAAAGVSVILYFFGTFSMFGSRWYLVPTGLYGAGLVMVGRAMVLEDE